MKVSSKARYALYLMIDITQHELEGPVSLREVSERQDISLKYLEQIASLLSKLGYLESVRGAQGGYRLAKEPSQINAGEIMRAAEGSFSSVACLESDAQGCPKHGKVCAVSAFWQGLHESIDSYTDKVSLEELAAH